MDLVYTTTCIVVVKKGGLRQQIWATLNHLNNPGRNHISMIGPLEKEGTKMTQQKVDPNMVKRSQDKNQRDTIL